jgi:hypothetical protein
MVSKIVQITASSVEKCGIKLRKRVPVSVTSRVESHRLLYVMFHGDSTQHTKAILSSYHCPFGPCLKIRLGQEFSKADGKIFR